MVDLLSAGTAGLCWRWFYLARICGARPNVWFFRIFRLGSISIRTTARLRARRSASH